LSDDNLSAGKLEEIATQALIFQRYIFRRAWGTYYAVWSAAFTVFIFSNLLPFQSLVPSGLLWITYAVLYGGVGLAAGFATISIFKNAHRTISLRKIVGTYRETEGRRYALMWFWWLGLYAIIFLSFAFFPREALSILFALLFTIEIYIYYSLKFSFQESIPIEGKIALASYGFCILFSFFASLFTNDFVPFGIVWGITIAAWLFSALYALRRASDELVASVY